MFIYYISEADDGEYECYLPDGKTSSVKLTVKKAEEASSTSKIAEQADEERHQNVNEIEGDENTNVDLSCRLAQSNQETLQWRKLNGVCR